MNVTTEELSRAGVGRRYRDTKLSNMGRPGSAALSWISEHMDAALERGDGLNICGEGEAGMMAVNAMTRALVVLGVKCQLIDLLDLVYGLKDDYVPGDDTVVLVSRFYVSGYGKNPLPMADVMMVEKYISDRIDNRSPVFIHATASPESWSSWWSDFLVNRLVAANAELKVTR